MNQSSFPFVFMYYGVTLNWWFINFVTGARRWDLLLGQEVGLVVGQGGGTRTGIKKLNVPVFVHVTVSAVS